MGISTLDYCIIVSLFWTDMVIIQSGSLPVIVPITQSSGHHCERSPGGVQGLHDDLCPMHHCVAVDK